MTIREGIPPSEIVTLSVIFGPRPRSLNSKSNLREAGASDASFIVPARLPPMTTTNDVPGSAAAAEQVSPAARIQIHRRIGLPPRGAYRERARTRHPIESPPMILDRARRVLQIEAD